MFVPKFNQAKDEKAKRHIANYSIPEAAISLPQTVLQLVLHTVLLLVAKVLQIRWKCVYGMCFYISQIPTISSA
jgi:hypothetical protein